MNRTCGVPSGMVMQDEDQPYLGVTDEEKYLIGMVTKSDLVNVGLGDTALGIELLKQTPVKNIAETIEGTLYYDDPEVHMNGKVSIIALTAAKLEKYDIRDRVVIVGDDPESQLELIKKGAGVLIVVCRTYMALIIEYKKRKNKVCERSSQVTITML